MRNRFFVWGPQLYSWPIKIVRGHDEYCNDTLGIVTWAGSVFVRTNKYVRTAGTCNDCLDIDD